MDDAIAATIQIMQAPKENVKIRSSYNLARWVLRLPKLQQKSRNTFQNHDKLWTGLARKLWTAGLLV
jgi:hypothetical protein